jgi:hypothetical protein
MIRPHFLPLPAPKVGNLKSTSVQMLGGVQSRQKHATERALIKAHVGTARGPSQHVCHTARGGGLAYGGDLHAITLTLKWV